MNPKKTSLVLLLSAYVRHVSLCQAVYETDDPDAAESAISDLIKVAQAEGIDCDLIDCRSAVEEVRRLLISLQTASSDEERRRLESSTDKDVCGDYAPYDLRYHVERDLIATAADQALTAQCCKESCLQYFHVLAESWCRCAIPANLSLKTANMVAAIFRLDSAVRSELESSFIATINQCNQSRPEWSSFYDAVTADPRSRIRSAGLDAVLGRFNNVSFPALDSRYRVLSAFEEVTAPQDQGAVRESMFQVCVIALTEKLSHANSSIFLDRAFRLLPQISQAQIEELFAKTFERGFFFLENQHIEDPRFWYWRQCMPTRADAKYSFLLVIELLKRVSVLGPTLRQTLLDCLVHTSGAFLYDDNYGDLLEVLRAIKELLLSRDMETSVVVFADRFERERLRELAQFFAQG